MNYAFGEGRRPEREQIATPERIAFVRWAPFQGRHNAQGVIGAAWKCTRSTQSSATLQEATITKSSTTSAIGKRRCAAITPGIASPRATFVRAGGLLENFLVSINGAAETGVLNSFLQPVNSAFPVVATQDVGDEVARLLTAAHWEGRRTIEVGSRITPNEVAAGMAEALGRDVVAQPIPREHWDAAIRAMRVPPEKAGNWAEMEDGFNSGWIDFGRARTEAITGTTSPAQVFAQSGGAARS